MQGGGREVQAETQAEGVASRLSVECSRGQARRLRFVFLCIIVVFLCTFFFVWYFHFIFLFRPGARSAISPERERGAGGGGWLRKQTKRAQNTTTKIEQIFC